MRPFLSNQWWSYLQTYGNRSRHGYAKGYAYPKMTPQAARRDAWPPSGGLPASDLDFVRQQHLDFYGISAAIMNPLSPTGQGDQNVELSIAMATAANEAQLAQLDRARAAAEVVGGGALRGRRRLRRGNPPARRQQRFRPGVHAEPHRRGGRPQALLADLRGRGRGRAAGRHPRLRLQRLADDELGLSVVLHRGDDRARHRGPGHGHQHDHGGHLRAPAGTEGRADRMRLRLAAGARLAARQALEAAQGRGAASEDGAVGIHQEALLGDDPADGGDREAGSPASR